MCGGLGGLPSPACSATGGDYEEGAGHLGGEEPGHGRVHQEQGVEVDGGPMVVMALLQRTPHPVVCGQLAISRRAIMGRTAPVSWRTSPSVLMALAHRWLLRAIQSRRKRDAAAARPIAAAVASQVMPGMPVASSFSPAWTPTG